MEKKRAQGFLVLSILTASCLVWSTNSPRELNIEHIPRESSVLGLQPGMEYTMTEGALDFEHEERFLQTLEQRSAGPSTAQSYGPGCDREVVLPHIGQ